MSPQMCFWCGCLSRTPVIIIKNARPMVLCRKCSSGGSGPAMDPNDVAQAVRTGSACHLCYAPMERPGGTTMSTLEGKRLIHVCFACKAIFPGGA